jgi:hypothetical protein
MHKAFACIECHMPDAGAFTRFPYKAKRVCRTFYHESLRDYPARFRFRRRQKIAEGNCRAANGLQWRTLFRSAASGNCTACTATLFMVRNSKGG